MTFMWYTEVMGPSRISWKQQVSSTVHRAHLHAKRSFPFLQNAKIHGRASTFSGRSCPNFETLDAKISVGIPQKESADRFLRWRQILHDPRVFFGLQWCRNLFFGFHRPDEHYSVRRRCSTNFNPSSKVFTQPVSTCASCWVIRGCSWCPSCGGYSTCCGRFRSYVMICIRHEDDIPRAAKIVIARRKGEQRCYRIQFAAWPFAVLCVHCLQIMVCSQSSMANSQHPFVFCRSAATAHGKKTSLLSSRVSRRGVKVKILERESLATGVLLRCCFASSQAQVQTRHWD